MDRRNVLIYGAFAFTGLLASGLSAQEADQAGFMLSRLVVDPNAPMMGNPAGDATIAEFFDYNCAICRDSQSAISNLLEKDLGVRVAIRHWPIFGPGSEYAARAALAADQQGRFSDVHHALMKARGRIDQATVDREIEKLGLDVEKLVHDMSSDRVNVHLSDTRGLASILGFSGTPVFVAGGKAYLGAANLETLEAIVADARGA